MFPIKCKDLLPVDHLVVKSVSVRGYLGPLTVWVSKKDANYDVDRNRRYRTRGTRESSLRRDHNRQQEDDGEHKIPLKPSSWIKLYEKTHDPCPRGCYTELVFNEPIILRPGEMRALYIHSTLPNDQAIVYDNSYYGSSDKRYEDDKLCILTGRAHVSPECFGQNPIWGWGNAWRERREFVGRLAYGTVYKLWNPEVQPKFGSNFQSGTRTLFLCQRRWESPMSMLPDEAIYYILNMCRWDWFDDSSDTMKERRKREKARKEKQKLEELEAKPASSMMDNNEDEQLDVKPSAKAAVSTQCGCTGSTAGAAEAAGSKTTGLSDDEDGDNDEDEDEEYVESSDDSDGANDANMEVEVVEVDEEMNDTEDADFESDESEDEDDYHRANRRYFGFQYPDSDEEEEEEKASAEAARNAWFHRRFARIHVLRALAAMEDEAINLEL